MPARMFFIYVPPQEKHTRGPAGASFVRARNY
jgi:hypothetical protein